MIKALEHFALDKENFESFLDDGVTLTDEQWMVIADEIDGRTAVFLDQVLPDIAQDFMEGNYDD
jgi:hypothetical protein